MILLYIILTALALVALYFVGVAVVYIVGFLVVGVKLAVGKTTIAELNEKAEIATLAKADNKKTKNKGDFSFLSYPSPLNNFGLWN